MGSQPRQAGEGEKRLLPDARRDPARGIDRRPHRTLLAAIVAQLGYGDRGRAVASLQRRLVTLGYLERGGIDGIFGDETSSAVVALSQRDR